MNFLIVDDHPDIRSIIKRLLGSAGDTFRECSTGEEALCLLETYTPDWITVDYCMGEMSGLALTKWVRARYPQIRCVIVSAFCEEELISLALEAGAAGFVRKDNLVELGRLISGKRAPGVVRGD